MPPGEGLRKLVHASMGLFALLLPFLSYGQAACCAVAAFFFNWQVLPRLLGHRFESAREGSGDVGVLAYPLVVFALILVFRHRLELAAFGWGVLAFGDSLAGVVGQKWGRMPLPWNPSKTWEGFAGFVLGGLVGGSLLALWFLAVKNPEARGLPGLVLGLSLWFGWGLVPCLFAAVLESVPCGLDDNVLPPLAAPVLGFLGSEGVPGPVAVDLGWGLVVNSLCAVLALATRTLRPGGVAVAWVLGVVTWAAFGWQGFLLLLAFLVAGLGATFLGWATKTKKGVAEGQGGRRGAPEVLAKGGVLLLLAIQGLGAGLTEGAAVSWAAVAVLAAAWADTWGSELGKLWGTRVFRLPDFARVPPGTPGGVSFAGLLASGLGAATAAGLGVAFGLVSEPTWAGLLALAAFVATLGESLLGRVPAASHGGRNLAVTLFPLVLLVALGGGRLP
ncbi:MAG: DUF92 domain-containing protein [Thermoanaerobaculum sp.]